MIGDHLLITTLLMWQAWDCATRAEWVSEWDDAWEEYTREQEPESGA